MFLKDGERRASGLRKPCPSAEGRDKGNGKGGTEKFTKPIGARRQREGFHERRDEHLLGEEEFVRLRLQLARGTSPEGLDSDSATLQGLITNGSLRLQERKHPHLARVCHVVPFLSVRPSI